MIRPYQSEDFKFLIQLLQSNTPQYFAVAETQDFIKYLKEKREDYYVTEQQGKIIACGGINYLKEGTEARISWDMVHPDWHGKGIGKQLTQHRLAIIKNNPKIRTIVVRTSQLAYRFYQKMGFELAKIEKNFWAKDLDLYQMIIIIRTP